MNITKCPTCNAPAKMSWSGLDLVAESGDETLASKHYEFEPTALNTVLAVSGLDESFLQGKLDGYIHKRNGYKEDSIYYGCYDLLVREFTLLLQMCQAACASGAVDTVAEGEEVCRCGNPSGLGNCHFEGDEELIYMCADCGKRAEFPNDEQP